VVTATVVLVPIAALLVGVRGVALTHQPQFPLASAWLVSRQIGELDLVDGASPGIDARVHVADLGDDLRGIQSGTTGYVIDVTDGSATRVDGRTMDTRRNPDLARVNGARIHLAATANLLAILDQDEGVALQADADTLQTSADRIELRTTLNDDDFATDSLGRVWVLPPATRRLQVVDGGRLRNISTTGAGSFLTSTAGHVLLVDPTRRTAALMTDSGVEDHVELDLQAGWNPTAARGLDDVSTPQFVLAAGQHLLDCRFSTRACTTLPDLPVGLGQTKALAASVDTGGRLYVPDRVTSTVLIIDLTQRSVRRTAPLMDAGRPFDLTVQGGVTFFNDPDSEKAGIINADGSVRPIDKYTPQDLARAKSQHAEGAAPNRTPSTSTARPKPRASATTNTVATTAHAQPTTPDTRSGPNIQPTPQATSTDRHRTAGTGSPSPGPEPFGLTIVISPARSGPVGQVFSFSAQAVGLTLTDATWLFGDGETGSGIPATHSYAHPGSYRVEVQARSDAGPRTGWTTIDIAIAGTPPRLVDLTTNPHPPLTGRPVTLTAGTSGGPIEQWSWTVHGPGMPGTTAATRTLITTFPQAGNYTVTLTVTGPGGADTLTRQITVEHPNAACGDLISASLVLNTDLDCHEDGLIVAANRITIDLGGHAITGHGVGSGITISGFAGATITNGTVSGFSSGRVSRDCITIGPSSPGVTVSDLLLEGCGVQAYRAFETSGVTVNNVTVHSGGLAFSNVSDLRVTNCRGWLNASISIGVDTQPSLIQGSVMTNTTVSYTESSNAAISGNTFTNSTIYISTSSNSARIQGNTFTGPSPNGNPTISILVSSGSVVAHNSFTRGRIGIQLQDASGADINNNQFVDEGAAGIYGINPGAVQISDTIMTSNGFGPGQFDDPAGNLVNDGIHLLLRKEGNVVLTNNHGRQNADRAIEAGPLPVSGSGNTSDGDPGGCTGVKCS
jgi:PKD repeat protein